MIKLQIELSSGNYPILIGEGIRTKIGSLLEELGFSQVHNKLFIITDRVVADLYLKDVINSVNARGFDVHTFIIPNGEPSKNIVMYESIMTKAIESKLNRHSIVLALGGGVVGDLAGFVAATFMRGVKYVQLPTTLLAHDSSVGGKVAINHELGKNMIGAFHQPSAVLYDTGTLRTLPPREIAAGFAEIIKEAWIEGPSFYDWILSNQSQLLQNNQQLLQEAIYRGCSLKTSIVSRDEKESNIRAYLNFGHTVGMALETITNYEKYLHGEAISIGMVAACKVSEKTYGIDHLSEEMESILKSFHLPTTIPRDLNCEEIIDIMKRDKKSKNNKIVMVLTTGIGKIEINDEIEEGLLKEVLESMLH